MIAVKELEPSSIMNILSYMELLFMLNPSTEYIFLGIKSIFAKEIMQ